MSHPPAQLDHYTDAQLTFYLQVFRDRREATWALSRLRRHYPGAKLIIVSDGDTHDGWSRIARRFDGRYVPGERLYGPECGGRIVHRTVEEFMQAPTDYLFKIDTDTWTHRRFRWLPTGRCVFGTLEWKTWAKDDRLDYPNIQGGFVGYTRAAAEEVFTSGVLTDPKLVADPAGTYADTVDILRRVREGMVSTDYLLRYACRVLDIPNVEYPEVRSLYRGYVKRDPPDQFAFTHPHKHMSRRHPLRHLVTDLLPAPLRRLVSGSRHFVRQALKGGVGKRGGAPRPQPTT